MAKTESSEGSHVIRNMVISVSTTVLGAAIIYLLGFNDKKTRFTKLEIKEITVNAWKTYVTIENIYTKNGASLLRDRVNLKIELEDFLAESAKESETLKSSLNELIKTEGIDKDLVSTFKRRLTNEDLMLERWSRVINRIKKFETSDWYAKMSEQQKTDTVMAEDKKYAEQIKGLLDRSLTDIEDLSKTLSDHYEQPFSMDDFLIIQVYKYKKDIFKLIASDGGSDAGPAVTKEYLTGKWNSNGSVVDLNADGKCSWVNPTSKSDLNGTWELKNDRLNMNLTNQQTKETIAWVLDLSDITQNSFIFKLAGDPANPFYTMVRM
ncbi:MAG TPA: hypothetical protein VI461_03910 [Chitinophagaceae bacterium]|nr:hypothetical protein [Chitinophagaceae bacterium]